MAKIPYILLLTIIVCNAHSAIAMDIPKETIHLVVVPGQNGLGGQNVDTVLPQFGQHTYHAETPNTIIDRIFT